MVDCPHCKATYEECSKMQDGYCCKACFPNPLMTHEDPELREMGREVIRQHRREREG